MFAISRGVKLNNFKTCLLSVVFTIRKVHEFITQPSYTTKCVSICNACVSLYIMHVWCLFCACVMVLLCLCNSFLELVCFFWACVMFLLSLSNNYSCFACEMVLLCLCDVSFEHVLCFFCPWVMVLVCLWNGSFVPVWWFFCSYLIFCLWFCYVSCVLV